MLTENARLCTGGIGGVKMEEIGITQQSIRAFREFLL